MRKLRVVGTISVLAFGLAAMLAASWYWRWHRPMPTPSTTISALDRQKHQAIPVPNLSPSASVTTQRTAWVFPLDEPIVVAPVIADEMVYVGVGQASASSRMVALDRRNGALVWMVPLDYLLDQPPVVAGDLLFVATRSVEMLALNRHTGEMVWSFRSQALVSGRPVVENGVLYFGADSVYALDAATGELIWRRDLGGRITRPLALASGVVVALGGNQSVYFLDAARGNQRLSFPLRFSPDNGPVVSGSIVAIAGERVRRPRVQALDLRGRDIFGEKPVRYVWTRLWLYGRFPRPPLPPGYAWQALDLGGVTGRLVAADVRRFYLALENADQQTQVVALDRESGAIDWNTGFSTRMAPVPVLLGQILVVGRADGLVSGLAADSGAPAWEIQMPTPITAGPAFYENIMFTALEDGSLRADELRIVPARGQ